MSQIYDRIRYVAPINATRQVSFIDAYRLLWKRWNDFRGRSSRQEYWKVTLDNIVIIIALTVLDLLLGMNGVLTNIYGLAILVPALALLVRRLHDANHSGKWAVLPVIVMVLGLLFAFVGASVVIGTIFLVLSLPSLAIDIVLLVFACQRSAPDNAYGAEPV
ncbi:MAG: DUF805 domain-containing protein [Ferrimicrobium acidiphilum]